MARKEAKTGQEPKPEELKPTTLLDFMSRFNLDGMKTVRFITRNPFHLGSHQVMLSLATDEFLGNVTAPHTFMLQPAEQKALKGQLKEAVGITAEGTAVSTVSGYSSSVAQSFCR